MVKTKGHKHMSLSIRSTGGTVGTTLSGLPMADRVELTPTPSGFLLNESSIGDVLGESENYLQGSLMRL